MEFQTKCPCGQQAMKAWAHEVRSQTITTALRSTTKRWEGSWSSREEKEIPIKIHNHLPAVKQDQGTNTRHLKSKKRPASDLFKVVSAWKDLRHLAEANTNHLWKNIPPDQTWKNLGRQSSKKLRPYSVKKKNHKTKRKQDLRNENQQK